MTFKTGVFNYWRGRSNPRKGQTFPRVPLSRDEVDQIMSAAVWNKPTLCGARDQAILAVLYRGGLRIKEALSLRIGDLDPDNCSLRILFGKNKKSRVVALDESAWRFVLTWLYYRPDYDTDLLFVTRTGRPVKSNSVRRMLGKRLKKQTGITKPIHPHGLRHTHAFELAQEGYPLHVISQQLGHSNIAHTSVYLQHLCPQDRIDMIRGREWEYGGKTKIPKEAPHLHESEPPDVDYRVYCSHCGQVMRQRQSISGIQHFAHQVTIPKEVKYGKVGCEASGNSNGAVTGPHSSR